jgi:zinc and cadmium transporter
MNLMETLWIVLFWSSIGGLVSLALASLLISNEKLRRRMILYAVPFGAGALLATAFTNTLPEALEGGGDAHDVLKYALIGFLVFFVVERLAGWLHGHHDHGEGRGQSQGVMVVVGDTLHNVIDGVAIGLAFLVDIPTGIITSVAVAAHEIPQEIGDFGILLSRGFSAGKVVLINALSGLAMVVAAVATYVLGAGSDWPLSYALAIAAGFFIYIAASDIIPEIHENPRRLANVQAALLIVGVIVITLVGTLLPHGHESGSDAHEEDCLPQSTLNAMGAPAPGETLPKACKEDH